MAYKFSLVISTIANIESYGNDVADMIQNFEACQNATGLYYGAVDVNVSDVASSGTVPPCFYNLPVSELHLIPSEGDTVYPSGDFMSPCWITLYQNATSASITVRQSYLPTNLQTAYIKARCCVKSLQSAMD